jgi:hypothetical protein
MMNVAVAEGANEDSALPSMWTGSLINRVDAEDVLSFTEMLLKVNYEMPARRRASLFVRHIFAPAECVGAAKGTRRQLPSRRCSLSNYSRL